MVVATITIDTEYGNLEIEVEVIALGPRLGTVWVQALEGRRPFLRQTHGGPCQDCSALVPKVCLRYVHLRMEPELEPVYEWVPADSFLESQYEERTAVEE